MLTVFTDDQDYIPSVLFHMYTSRKKANDIGERWLRLSEAKEKSAYIKRTGNDIGFYASPVGQRVLDSNFIVHGHRVR